MDLSTEQIDKMKQSVDIKKPITTAPVFSTPIFEAPINLNAFEPNFKSLQEGGDNSPF
jgi:hypothetical protein